MNKVHNDNPLPSIEYIGITKEDLDLLCKSYIYENTTKKYKEDWFTYLVDSILEKTTFKFDDLTGYSVLTEQALRNILWRYIIEIDDELLNKTMFELFSVESSKDPAYNGIVETIHMKLEGIYKILLTNCDTWLNDIVGSCGMDFEKYLALESEYRVILAMQSDKSRHLAWQRLNSFLFNYPQDHITFEKQLKLVTLEDLYTNKYNGERFIDIGLRLIIEHPVGLRSLIQRINGDISIFSMLSAEDATLVNILMGMHHNWKSIEYIEANFNSSFNIENFNILFPLSGSHSWPSVNGFFELFDVVIEKKSFLCFVDPEKIVSFLLNFRNFTTPNIYHTLKTRLCSFLLKIDKLYKCKNSIPAKSTLEQLENKEIIFAGKKIVVNPSIGLLQRIMHIVRLIKYKFFIPLKKWTSGKVQAIVELVNSIIVFVTFMMFMSRMKESAAGLYEKLHSSFLHGYNYVVGIKNVATGCVRSLVYNKSLQGYFNVIQTKYDDFTEIVRGALV
ncbi:hypothetical protein NEMIN01_1113 [Nematocida minor]|uniref:uncharacterized protein n=1 Tax=Nematocida minor TaxID=1912983 RepID=UPI00221E6634|nr:uncharacterized protein NEMIN01_1113 [Nematocida minor]KAI5190575.1 hypothetical protein NEMIN01_1113 [Nematocida minor]